MLACCVLKEGRDRETERERERQRQRQRDRETQRERQRETERDFKIIMPGDLWLCLSVEIYSFRGISCKTP